MTDLTGDQKRRLRRRIGDTGSTKAFSDPELQDAFDEAEDDLDAATVILLEWLMADVAKFSDYSAGQTSEKKSQVFDHLQKLLAQWEAKVAAANRGPMVKIVGMRSVPPRERDEPSA